MQTKASILVLFFLLLTATNWAQIENQDNSVRFEMEEDDYEMPTEYELPVIETPSITDPKSDFIPDDFSDLGKDKQELDITFQENFIDVKSNKAPKYFTKDKAISDEFGKDQYLGEIRTQTGNVTIMYRDHEYVDGDRVRIFVNGDIVKTSVYLSGSFSGFTFPLQVGFNKVEFQALNQGSSGPNTAELMIYDETGATLASNEWNLNTGRKASVSIIKE